MFMPWWPLIGLLARLKADRKGGVLMIMGLSIVPLTFATGFGIDYARAMRLQTHLNSAADAAALAAVSPAMILLSDDASTAAAQNMFDSQASTLGGYQNLQRTVTIADSTSGSGNTLGYLRSATVNYTVQSINFFGSILGAKTLTLHGTASATAAQPPNVDFYLAMDNSPSMLLPATSDGITKVQNVTGCAFSCHEQMPLLDPIVVTDSAKRQVLLSTSYYTAGASKQNVYYLYDKNNAILYDSTGAAMNPAPTTVVSPTTTSNNGNTSTTVTTTTTVSYIVTDSSTGPATITKKTSSTPTTVRKTGNGSPTSTTGTTTTTSSVYDTGYWADGYWLTHNYGLLYGSPSSLVLRKDDVVSAATQLIPFAATQAAQYKVTYQAQMFAFDWTKSGSSSPLRHSIISLM